MTATTPPSAPNKDQAPAVREVNPNESTVLGIGFAWELGYTIAIPAILFGIGGGYMDDLLGTKPLFLLVGLALSFVISFSIIAGKIRVIMARMPKDLPRKKKEPLDEDSKKEQDALHDLFRPPSNPQ